MSYGGYARRFGLSIYSQKPQDPQAVDFKPVNRNDCGPELQAAVTGLKKKAEYGIIFVPEGDYLLRETIYIPKGIRIFGYGQKRPRFILANDAPGFQKAPAGDPGKGVYLFWFVDRVPMHGEPVPDAHPGTFYSALSNVDIFLGEGNPAAVAIRSHFAQHCFISWMDIHIGSARAGIFDVGNEVENVRFFGGDYGIDTRKPSPGWPFLLCDACFEGQRRAAIRSQEAGLTIVRLTVRNTPVVFETVDGFIEKIYLEDARIEEAGTLLRLACEDVSLTQINFRNVLCRRVPCVAELKESGKRIARPEEIYRIASFTHGLQTESGGIDQPFAMDTVCEIEAAKSFPAIEESDMPYIPDVASWVSVRDLGVVGDGIADDTQALNRAIEKHRVLYLPQGT